MKSKISKSIKPLIQPIWERIWYRIQFRVNALIDAKMSQRNPQSFASANDYEQMRSHILDSLRAQSNVLLDCKRQLNDFQTALADNDNIQAKINELKQDQSKIESRIEFVRREILFEFKYGWDAGSTNIYDNNADSIALSVGNPSIKNSSYLSSREIRLNLGCGLHPMKGHINIDARDLPGVDIVTSVDNLPFDRNSVDEIFSSHLIEHFPQERLVRKLLPYWLSLLRPGGVFHAIAPDCDAMIKHASSGDLAFEEFREVLFGSQDYAGDFHYNALTPNSFTELLTEAGFENIEIIEQARRNGLCYEFEVRCVKPS